MSRTFLATLQYDGTGFVGWQRQPAGRSVQGEIERVLERLFARRTVAHAAGRTDAGVHAIKSAISRRYRYDIGLDDESASPFRARYEWVLCRQVDMELLHAATKIIHGEHDFRGFAAKTDKPHYRCRILEAIWVQRPDDHGLSFTIEADRFLQRMVRMLVGTMIDIGMGRRALTDMAELLESDHNQNTSAPAPPQGLYFESVTYPPDLYAESD